MTSAPGANHAAAEPRVSLRDLSLALRGLHKALLDAELENFPMARGTADRLKLVVEHPSFAWLRALSGMIVEFDDLEDSGSVTAPALRQGRQTVERLLGPAAPSHTDFRKRYLEYLQLVPEVAIATGTVRQRLAEIGGFAQAGG